MVRAHIIEECIDHETTSSDKTRVPTRTPELLGSIVEHGLSPKLNVIFDVDHTLIYAFERRWTNMIPGTTRDTHLLKLNDVHGTEMTLVVREGIQEMFEFLQPFCTFYVYSHGLKSYIDLILDKIDPDQRFFKNRHERVVAPLNPLE